MFYYTAFWDLNTTRSYGMSEGPIPWTAVQEYCRYTDLDKEESKDLHFHIQRLDNAFLMERNKDNG